MINNDITIAPSKTTAFLKLVPFNLLDQIHQEKFLGHQ